ITHDLPIIHGVSAMLTPAQAARLRQLGTVDLFADSAVTTQDHSDSRRRSTSSSSRPSSSSPDASTVPNQDARAEIGADRLAAQGFDGTGVAVAVLDSGLPSSWVQYAQNSNMGLIAYSADGSSFQDASGHGSHVTTIVANPIRSVNGQPLGIAPQVRLVSVKAFDANGTSTYATVLNGLDWIFNNRATYNIRVLNLSFAAKPQSFYWNDPIDQAVMKLWQAGVVVVASAGNGGPTAQTIGVPGNTPYIITVGAMTDNYAPSNPLGWRLTSFSSAGPTFEGFVKPDILAPGGHIIGIMDPQTARLAQLHPTFALPVDNLYVMSGTSQAAAVVSASVALMLQSNPALTPDVVK
ncbi:MAG TPA: S8 family peptidase, partial [Steroidobacteraceae bacterium]|nr:S8 family peptidase [Steroidobacteraceae bacterium]